MKARPRADSRKDQSICIIVAMYMRRLILSTPFGAELLY